MSTEKDYTSTERDFAKKEYKHLSKWEKFMVWAVPIIAIIITLMFTWFAFIDKPSEPCDPIEQIGLWCKIHPTNIWDVAGLILFYYGGLWIGSLIPRLLIAIGVLSDDSDKFPALNLIGALATLIGFALIYLV